MSDLPSKMDVDRAVTTMKRTESSTGSDEIMTVETAPSIASTTSSNRTSEWTAASRPTPTSTTRLQLNRTAVTASSDLSSSTTGDDGSSVTMIIDRSSSSGVFSSFSDDLSTVEPIYGLLNEAGSSTSTSGAKRKRRRRGRRRSMPRQRPDEGIKDDDEDKQDNQEATSSSANRSERQDDDNSGESSNTRTRSLFAPQKREFHPYALANDILAEVERTSVNDDDGNFFGSIA